MTSPVSSETQSLSQLYETDYLRWLDAMAARLREGAYDALDREHLIEELEAIGRNEKRAAASNLQVLLLHLLKWQYQPQRRTASWSNTIDTHREQLADALEESPSLRNVLAQQLEREYGRARRKATRETGLPEIAFPQQCPYDLASVLDFDWWPED